MEITKGGEQKLKIYKLATRPVVSYAVETMSLTDRKKEKQRGLEKKVPERSTG